MGMRLALNGSKVVVIVSYIYINVFAIINRYFNKLNRLNTSKKERHVSLFDHITSKKEV